MIISSYGFTAFKLQSGDIVVAIDPPAKGARFETKVALFTDPKAPLDTSLAGSPHIFAVPGEYEVSDIAFRGFPAGDATPFLIEWESMHILHLGAVSKIAAIEEMLDEIGTIDILFVVAGNSDAQKIVSQIDPRIIIPMETENTKKNALELFAKELGEKPERMDKLTIKAKALPAEGQRLIILNDEHARA